MNNWNLPDPFSSNENHPRITFTPAERFRVWVREFEDYEGKCPICGKKITLKTFQMGHKVSLANGGSNRVDNLRPICQKCNQKMGDKNWRDFIKQLRKEGDKKRKKSKKPEIDSPFDNPPKYGFPDIKTPVISIPKLPDFKL